MKKNNIILIPIISTLLTSCTPIIEFPIGTPEFLVKSKINKFSDAFHNGMNNKEFQHNFAWCNQKYISSRDKYIKENTGYQIKQVSLFELIFSKDNKKDKNKEFSPVIAKECTLAFDVAKKECFINKKMEYCFALIDLSKYLSNEKMLYRTAKYMNKDINRTRKDLNKYFAKNKIIQSIDGTLFQNHKFKLKYNWNEAKKYCENLDFAGYTDWKLPKQYQLKKLISSNKYTSTYTKSYFINNQLLENLANKERIIFWSSSKSSKKPTYSLGVNFTKGKGYIYKQSQKHYVTCILPKGAL